MELKEDRPAWVQFEVRAVQRRNDKGELVSVDVNFALVTPPYSRDCVELIADEWLAQCDVDVNAGRLPGAWRDQWKAKYEAWKKGQELPVDGMPLKNWSLITPAQLKNLLHLGHRSVEDVAGMNEEGMRAFGMGGLDLKNKAVAFLKAQSGPGKVAAENSALKVKLTELEQTVAQQQETIAELQKSLKKAA